MEGWGLPKRGSPTRPTRKEFATICLKQGMTFKYEVLVTMVKGSRLGVNETWVKRERRSAILLLQCALCGLPTAVHLDVQPGGVVNLEYG